MEAKVNGNFMIFSSSIHFASFSPNCFRSFYHYMNFKFQNNFCYSLFITFSLFLKGMEFCFQNFFFFNLFTFLKFRFFMGMNQKHFSYVLIKDRFDLHPKNQGCLKTLIVHFFQY
jgi:hypothetical protein